MSRKFSLSLLASASFIGAGFDPAMAIDAVTPYVEPAVIYAQPPAQRPPMQRAVYAERPSMGGGFIEFLFGDGPAQPGGARPPNYSYEARRPLLPPMEPQPRGADPQDQAVDAGRPTMDPRYQPQPVDYTGNEAAGTIVIDTPNKFLYLVQGGVHDGHSFFAVMVLTPDQVKPGRPTPMP